MCVNCTEFSQYFLCNIINRSIIWERKKLIFLFHLHTSFKCSFQVIQGFFTSLRSWGKLIYGLSMTSRIEWMCCIDSWQNVFVNFSFMLVLLLLLHFYKCLIYFVSPENSIAFWRCCFYKNRCFYISAVFSPLTKKSWNCISVKKLAWEASHTAATSTSSKTTWNLKDVKGLKKLAAHFVALVAIL